MLRRRVSALLLLGLLTWAAPLCAAEALDAISSEASVVVRLKNPKATIEKIAGLVDMVQPGMGGMVRQNAMTIGIAITNPSLAGVDQNNDWYMALYAQGGQTEPQIVFVIPSTDLKAMKEALGDHIKFLEHEKWGVYTSDAATSEKTAARIKGSGSSIKASIDKETIASLDKSDFGVFINAAQLVKGYKNELQQAREHAKQALDNIPQQATSGIDPTVLAKMLAPMLSGVFQGLEDTKSISVALTVSKEGLAFEDLVRVNAGSEFDKFLQKSPATGLELVSNMPSGNPLYAGFSFDLASMIKLAGGLVEMMVTDADAKKEFAAAMEEASKLKYGTTAMTLGLGSIKDGAFISTAVYEVSPAAKYREIMQRQQKLATAIKTPGVKQTISVQKDAEKYGSHSADLITQKMEFEDADNPGAAVMQKFMQAIYGPEGMVHRVVTIKDRVIQTTGGGKDAMTKAIASLEAKPAPSSAFDQARKSLAPKANVVFLLDLPGLIAKGAKMAIESGMVPIPLEASAIDGLQLKESYIGFSVGTEPQGIRCNTNIPADQIQGVAKIGMLVATLMQQGRN